MKVSHCWFLFIIDFDWFFQNLFIFNWRRIALQYCIGFCHISAWISHRHTHIPSLLNLHFPLYPTLLGCQSTGLELISTSYLILHMEMYICTILSIHPPFSFTISVHKSILYVCLYYCPEGVCSSVLIFVCFFDTIFSYIWVPS